jgi:cytoskeletal protein CcmA (bactofilin family)
MRNTRAWTSFALTLALLSAGLCMAADYDATVIVEADEALRLAEGETVHGDLIVMGGKAHVLGRVTGNVVVVDGRATLGPTARVDGDALTVRGEIIVHKLASVAGEQHKLSAEEFAGLMTGAGETPDAEAEAAEAEEPAEPEASAEAIPVELSGDLTNYGTEIVVPEGEVRDGDVSSFGGPVTIEGQVRGDVVSMGGPIRINGEVDGSVTTFGGPVYITGRLRGQVASFGGNVFLRDGCHVTGNVASFGGRVNREDGAQLDGEVADFGGGRLAWLLGRGGSKLGNITALALTLLIALVFPNATRTVADAISDRPGAAAAHGAVALLLVGPVCVALAITCVGLAGVPLVIALVGALDMLGIVAVNLVVGRKAARMMNWSVGSVIGLAVIGTMVLRLVAAARLAPFLGMIAGLVAVAVVVFGIGGAVMTRFGTDPSGTYITRRVHPDKTAAPEDVA